MYLDMYAAKWGITIEVVDKLISEIWCDLSSTYTNVQLHKKTHIPETNR